MALCWVNNFHATRLVASICRYGQCIASISVSPAYFFLMMIARYHHLYYIAAYTCPLLLQLYNSMMFIGCQVEGGKDFQLKASRSWTIIITLLLAEIASYNKIINKHNNIDVKRI